MAAPSHAFTIQRVAQILDCDENLIWDISDQLEPEDGMLWIQDTEGTQVLAFTQNGIETLREIIEDQILNAD